MEQNKITIPIHTLSLTEHKVNVDFRRLATKKLNKLQNIIAFTKGEFIAGPKIPRRPSYGKDILASYIEDFFNANTPSICLVNLPLKNHYYQKIGSCATISIADYNEVDSYIALDTYIAYLAAKFLIEHYFPSLSKLDHLELCPTKNYRRNLAVRKLNIGYGKLCQVCLDRLRPIVGKRPVDPEIKDAIDLILKKCGDEARQSGVKHSIIPFQESYKMPVETLSSDLDNPTQQQQVVTPSEKDDSIEAKIPTQEELNAELAGEDLEESYTDNESIIKPPDDTPVALDTETDQAPVGDKTENQTDELNHKVYADLFANMILNPKTATPLTIGLGAAWGRGKTFLAKQIRDQVVGKENIRCVWFNAWKHSKAGNIWIHFYTAIVDSLGINRSFGKRYTFIWHLFWRRHDNLLQHLRWVGPYLFGLSVLMSVFVHRNFDLIELFYVLSPFGSFMPLLFNLGSIASIIAIGGLIWKIIRPISSQVLPRLSLAGFDKKFASQEQILKNIGYLRDWQIKNCKDERIVVFVDDIDRCKPAEIVGVLEALQLFLEDTNIIFVLAMDTKVVRFAIAERYKFMKETNGETIGRQYLEKIIQIPFHIPEPTKKMFMKYAATLLHKDILNWRDERKELDSEEPINEESEETVEIQDQAEEDEVIVSAQDYKDQKAADEKAITEDTNNEEVTDDNKPKPYDDLTVSEWKIVGEVLAVENFKLSPRLLIRFTEIYKLSKILILESGINLRKGLLNSYIAWLALSIKYPEETKALQESFVSNNWVVFAPKPNDKKYPWITSIKEDPVEMVDDYEINFDKDTILKDAIFSKCDHVKVSEMMNLYIRHYKINNLELQRVASIYNCFNLMLD